MSKQMDDRIAQTFFKKVKYITELGYEAIGYDMTGVGGGGGFGA